MSAACCHPRFLIFYAEVWSFRAMRFHFADNALVVFLPIGTGAYILVFLCVLDLTLVILVCLFCCYCFKFPLSGVALSRDWQLPGWEAKIGIIFDTAKSFVLKSPTLCGFCRTKAVFLAYCKQKEGKICVEVKNLLLSIGAKSIASCLLGGFS